MIQFVGLLGGILVIRLLPKEQYALYTIANTMLGTMTILADGGISQAVLAQGGRFFKDKLHLSTIARTGLILRKQFAIGSLIIALPILIYLLLQNNANWFTALLIALAVIPAFYSSLSDKIYQIPLKLHQDIPPLQKNQIAVSLGRLTLILTLAFLFPFTFVVLTADGISRIFGNLRLKKISSKYVDYSVAENKDVKREILSFVLKIMPASVYFCFYSQISIWLISFFGNSEKVAELGAISRLTLTTTVFTVMFTTLISPRFARLPQKKSLLRNRARIILFGAIILVFSIVLTVYLVSDILLWFLGDEYSELNQEVVFLFLANGMSLLSSFAYSLYVSRGWMMKPYIYIPINFVTLSACIYLIDISTLVGVISINIIVSSIMFILNTVYIFLKINRMQYVD